MERPMFPAAICLDPVMSGIQLSEHEQNLYNQNLEKLLFTERQLTATPEEAIAVSQKENDALKEESKEHILPEKFDASELERPTHSPLPTQFDMFKKLRQSQPPPKPLGYKSAVSNFQEHFGPCRYLPSSTNGSTKQKHAPEALKRCFTPHAPIGRRDPTMSASSSSCPKLRDPALSIAPVLATCELEKAKIGSRRKSHTVVNRMKSNHISQKIQEVAHLIPHHRLHKPNLPTIPNSIPEPSIPDTNIEKGPHKGEILAGAVDWIRDLMWMADVLLQREEERSRSLGFDLLDDITKNEDERRMLDELRESIMVTDARDFGYSRTVETTWEIVSPGSSLSISIDIDPVLRDKTRSLPHSDSQTQWVCMLGDPALQTENGWVCAFCIHSQSSRREMVNHLIKEHRINNCTMKPLVNRNWTRKDKLKEHLQQMHALSPDSDYWEHWHRPSSGNIIS